MIFCTKKYLSLFLFVFLLGGFEQINAQTADSVNIRCVSVDAAGDVTLTWVLPSGASLTSDGFLNYTVLGSPTGLPGTYTTMGLPPIFNPAQTSISISAASLPASPNSQQVYFCITTINSSSPPYNSDTVSSMYLYVTNPGNGTAILNWNAIHNLLPQGSNKWYQIYRDYNNLWTLIDSVRAYDSVQSLNYIDTITYCSATLNYQIQIGDSTVCVSTSNQAGSTSPFINKIPPPLAIIDTVSVTPANTVDITWSKSQKANVIGYIVYVNIGANVYQAVATINNINTTSYNYTGGNPSDSSLLFQVALLDSCGKAGTISSTGQTIFLRETSDPCGHKNMLNWNGYIDIAGNSGNTDIGGYKIFYNVNGGAYQLLARTGPKVIQYIDSNLYTQETRSYYVQVYDSIHKDTTASSNIVYYAVKTATMPRFQYLRYASVVPFTSGVSLSYYLDTLSGAEFYAFIRADSTGKFKTIVTDSAQRHNDLINYVDNSIDPSKQSYTYRVVTLDSCSNPIDTSNIGKTVLLIAVGKPDINELTWNNYTSWSTSPIQYFIYRSVDGTNFTHIATENAGGQNTYDDDISGITTGQGIFYYYVFTQEPGVIDPFIDSVYSNVALAYQDPIVWVPNAFDPNGINRIFKPVGVFVDVTGYDFVIINRWGIKVFESTDPEKGWDGHYNNSKKAEQEDVYVYLLTYTSSKGQYFQKKGTVTLLK